MAQVIVLGAGISGHTAAMCLRRLLPSTHSVVVVSPKPDYNWIPSNIWVGVGRMAPEKVVIPLKPVYDKLGVRFVQAAGVSIHPDGAADGRGPFLRVASTLTSTQGQIEEIGYDYLINATGPRLRFDRTEGLGPDAGYTQSVCTEKHAAHAAVALKESIERMKRGERQKLVIGMGHGTCTCEGAAFEYTFNVEHELRAAGVRDKAEVLYVTNEADLGDFGVDGLVVKRGGYRTPSRIFAASLYGERGI